MCPRPHRAAGSWTAAPGLDPGSSPLGGRHPAIVADAVAPEAAPLPDDKSSPAGEAPTLEGVGDRHHEFVLAGERLRLGEIEGVRLGLPHDSRRSMTMRPAVTRCPVEELERCLHVPIAALAVVETGEGFEPEASRCWTPLVGRAELDGGAPLSFDNGGLRRLSLGAGAAVRMAASILSAQSRSAIRSRIDLALGSCR
jgi:hypothetical protein